jgi:mRNA interferase HigB
MRIIAWSTLRAYIQGLTGHKDQQAVETALVAWNNKVSDANWQGPADVKRDYGNASIVGNDRVVFNIKGNAYRLVVSIDYGRRTVFIKWVGTHAAYDKIDVETVAYGH